VVLLLLKRAAKFERRLSSRRETGEARLVLTGDAPTQAAASWEEEKTSFDSIEGYLKRSRRTLTWIPS